MPIVKETYVIGMKQQIIGIIIGIIKRVRQFGQLVPIELLHFGIEVLERLEAELVLCRLLLELVYFALEATYLALFTFILTAYFVVV